METKIKRIFSKDLVTVKETQSLAEADSLMDRHVIRHLPVLDNDDFLVGMLSRTDYMALKHLKLDLATFPVAPMMSSPVKTFAANARVKAVAQLFLAQKISSGLVMENNEIVGIVTVDDLLRLIAEADDGTSVEDLDLELLASEGWISATRLR